MLTSRDFWLGILVGLLLFYVYQNHIKKGPAQ